MSRPRTADPRAKRPDVIVISEPELAVADEEREVLSDILSELLVSEIEPDEETRR